MADHTVLQESLESQDNSVPFESKKWTYITDSSSSAGVFSGQIQFDLNTLSSQNQWTDLSEAYVQFPVKLNIKSTGTAAALGTNFSGTIKNGFHQFIDSCQISLGGTTIQSSQIFENINAQFKILTSWSTDELNKYGSTLGLALDDYVEAVGTTAASLDSVAIATTMPTFAGTSLPVANNPGYLERSRNNTSIDTANTAAALLGATNISFTGKRPVQITTGTVTAGFDVFTAFYLATVRLKDISDVCSKLPLIKGMKGFIYLNYNAAQSVAIYSDATTVSAAPTNTSIFGRIMPGLFNRIGFAATAGDTYTLSADVSGVKSANLTTATPTRTEARLYAPYFVASPAVDRALTMKKTIRYLERYVRPMTVEASGTLNQTLTPGITNPKMVILFPYNYNTAAPLTTAGLLTMQRNPLLSPFDTVPATTSPFASIQNLQITVGNVPMFQNPVNMNFEMFMNEVAQLGQDGGLDSETTLSGLLNERKWNQLYRFYACNVGRRMGSDDGASKSVQVSLQNSTGQAMSIIAIVLYERELTVDTALGSIVQGL